jgi:methenyltetrahydrofolate cyclohydrolase
MEIAQEKGFDYLGKPLKNYLNRVSAKTPVPGGGSVAACVASLSASLLTMVLNYTIGKERYALYQKEIEDFKEETNRMLEKLSGYIEEDSRVYRLIRRYSVERKTAFAERELKKSAEIHLDICKISLRIVDLSEVLTVKGNRSLISDTGIAASLAVSSFKSARMNVLINLKYIGDKEFVKDSTHRIETMEKEVVTKGEAVYKKVEGILKESK